MGIECNFWKYLIDIGSIRTNVQWKRQQLHRHNSSIYYNENFAKDYWERIKPIKLMRWSVYRNGRSLDHIFSTNLEKVFADDTLLLAQTKTSSKTWHMQ